MLIYQKLPMGVGANCKERNVGYVETQRSPAGLGEGAGGLE